MGWDKFGAQSGLVKPNTSIRLAFPGVSGFTGPRASLDLWLLCMNVGEEEEEGGKLRPSLCHFAL